MHSIAIAECHLLVLDLNRDGYEDRVAGNAHEVGAIVECDLIADDSRANDFLKILEFDRWRHLHLCKLFEPGELILAFEPATAHRDRCGGTVGAGETSSLAGHAHLFHHAQYGTGDPRQ